MVENAAYRLKLNHLIIKNEHLEDKNSSILKNEMCEQKQFKFHKVLEAGIYGNNKYNLFYSL